MKHYTVKGKEKGTIVFIHGNSSSSNVFKSVMQSDLIPQTKITN
jgi:pimeloyl-ACP methyl ester carboxylesterase